MINCYVQAVDPRAQRRSVVLVALLTWSMVSAAEPPSDRLLDSALADHFTRFFCISRFPRMQGEIQVAYDASPFRYLAVPCRGLKCSSKEHADGMQRLWTNAENLSDDEARDVCVSYGDTLKALVAEHDSEFQSLFPWIKRK